MSFNTTIFKRTILLIAALEGLSFLGYFFAAANKAGFIALLIATFIVSVVRLEYGVWMVLAELVIASKGYLFTFGPVSVRIGMWLVVMMVWFGKTGLDLIKTKRLKAEAKDFFMGLKKDARLYFALLFFFIAWGIANGLLNNPSSNVFFDANGWIYFLLIFPLWSAINDRDSLEKLLTVLAAAMIWLSFKTLLLLFVFSHAMLDLIFPLYRWIRVTGVGEITQIGGGFYRIFMQSHIYELLAFVVAATWVIKKIANETTSSLLRSKTGKWALASLSLSLAVILISFSRSFWVGFAAGLVLIYACLYRSLPQTATMPDKIRLYLKKAFDLLVILVLSFTIALTLIVVVVKFPYPKPLNTEVVNAFSERATESNEAAIGSRWSLLPPLWQSIKGAPILGKGFGSTVTYFSKDPRVLEKNPSGEYSTFAFEWGWLDIWLKLGLVGALAYLALLGYLAAIAVKNRNDQLLVSLALGLAVLAVVNFFTPFLNHPLGIGFIILTAVILTKIKQK